MHFSGRVKNLVSHFLSVPAGVRGVVLFAYFIGILLFAKLPAVGIPLVFLATFASSFYFFKRGILRRF